MRLKGRIVLLKQFFLSPTMGQETNLGRVLQQVKLVKPSLYDYNLPVFILILYSKSMKEAL
jgi:hypothetical protein